MRLALDGAAADEKRAVPLSRPAVGFSRAEVPHYTFNLCHKASAWHCGVQYVTQCCLL